MKREEWLALGYTEEQVSEILDKFHKNSEHLSKQVADLQTQLDSEKNKVAGLTKKEAELNALKADQLSAEEKMALKEKEIEENLIKSRKVFNTATAKSILAGYEVADDVLNSLVTDNEEVTTKNINALKAMLDARDERVSNKAIQEVASRDVKPTPSNNLNQDNVMTWEKFDKMSADEQVEYADKHPDEFAQLQ